MTKNTTKIAPSILSADFANLERDIKDIDKAGADYIHFDVMDGSFVPNITFGPDIIKSVRGFTDKTFDVHLMIQNPQNYINHFAAAGADIITIHQEAVIHHQRVLSQIKSTKSCLNNSVKAGISIVPSTNESTLDYLYEDLDLILVMTVNPGFGGQSFLTSQLKKIENIANKVNKIGKQIDISVDGGINYETATLVKNCGANVLVAGSFIFNNKNGENKEQIIQNLRK